MRARHSLTLWWIVLLAAGREGLALINAALQPADLFARHNHVIVGRFTKADPQAACAEIQVTASLKGTYAAGQTVAVTFGPGVREMLAEAARTGDLKVGAPVAAFVGSDLRRRERKVILYAGTYFIGEANSPSAWGITEGDEQLEDTQGRKVPSLAGTWNGSTGRLAELLADIAAGRAHFPRHAYARFRKDVLLDRFEGEPPRGVALYDVDGDGDLDAYACSYGGDRLYLQMEPLVFVNATEWVGLETDSASCSFADVDCDGQADLLADAAILRGVRDGKRLRFQATAWLPESANEDVKSAAFVELNGDGWPDVVVSRSQGGLRAYLNPGPRGGAFAEATQAMGLSRKDCGAGLTGFFAAGDWNDDGRTDLWYSAGAGLLLVQDSRGVFAPVDHGLRMSFASGPEDEPGMTGAGFFAPILGVERLDLVVPVADGWHVIENRAGRPVDVTEHGNEISEGSHLHLASISEDLNLDGHVDFYTVSRASNGHNRFLINRGYGSFMLAEVHRYYERMFTGPAHTLGGWGVAAGDVDGDAAPDLLVSSPQGALSLLLNETLALRTDVAHPTDDVARLLKVRLLTVALRGPCGVVGARVTLADAAGTVVARRDLGGNIATGCRGPDTLTLAVRQPGRYVLTVRYADGASRSWPVDLSGSAPVRVEAHRPAPDDPVPPRP